MSRAIGLLRPVLGVLGQARRLTSGGVPQLLPRIGKVCDIGKVGIISASRGDRLFVQDAGLDHLFDARVDYGVVRHIPWGTKVWWKPSWNPFAVLQFQACENGKELCRCSSVAGLVNRRGEKLTKDPPAKDHQEECAMSKTERVVGLVCLLS